MYVPKHLITVSIVAIVVPKFELGTARLVVDLIVLPVSLLTAAVIKLVVAITLTVMVVI